MTPPITVDRRGVVCRAGTIEAGQPVVSGGPMVAVGAVADVLS